MKNRQSQHVAVFEEYAMLIVLIFLLNITIATDGVSQGVLSVKDAVISIDLENVTIERAFKEIEEKSDYIFVYNHSKINNKARISVTARNESLEHLLSSISEQANLSFRQVSDKISVKPQGKKALDTSFVVPISHAEAPIIQETVTGRVTDSNGDALPGATIVEKGTTNGTVTDADGKYQLIVQQGAVLVVSFVGYESQEISVNDRAVIDITLSSSIANLEEVVVVGYGTQKKLNVTGAMASVTRDDLIKAPVASLTNALSGRLPGVIATQRSGEPGQDEADIFIRGVGTPGDPSPLYVIDGIERTRADFSQLDPNEIESVNIVKDAAAAIFGVRAANGVVLVTTRRGATGKPNVSYGYNIGFQSPAMLPKFLGSAGYAELLNEATINAGGAPVFTEDQIQKYRDGSDPYNFPNTDWADAVLDDYAVMQKHNVNVSGGSENVKYFVSGGFLDQNGLYETNEFKRYNLRSNIDANLTKTTRLSLDISGRLEKNRQPNSSTDGIFFGITRNIPILSPYNENGTFRNISPYPNLVASVSKGPGYQNTDRSAILTTITLEQQLFVQGLSGKVVLAYDRTDTKFKNWSASQVLYGIDGTPTPFASPSLRERFDQTVRFTPQVHLNYSRSFNDHSVSGLLVYTQTKTGSNFFEGFTRNYVTAAIDQAFFGTSVQDQQYTGQEDNFGRRGLAGRFTYDFKSTYLFEFSFRYDGSENFPKNGRFGFFPAIAGGWVVSNEDFMKEINAINFLKFRASYGIVGNDKLALTAGADPERFLYLATYDAYQSPGNDANLGAYAFNGQYAAGIVPGALANPNITWEKVSKFNAGVELELFDNKVSLDVDYFHDRRTDILAKRNLAIPVTFGADLPAENLGEVINRGVEGIFMFRETRGAFKYNIGGSLTFARSKVINLEEAENVPPAVKKEGKPLNQFIGLKAIGIFQSQEEIDNSPDQSALGGTTGGKVHPGDVRYADINGDGVVNADDRGAVGRSNIPQLIYGIMGGVAYKGLELNFMFQGAGMVDQYLTQQAIGAFFNGGKVAEVWLDRWTPNNPGAEYPRILVDPGQNAPSSATSLSSLWLQDASYLRLKNVELSYSFPSKLISSLGLGGLRVYVSGQNLLTFTDMFVDPENANEHGRYYPQMKVYNLGATVQF